MKNLFLISTNYRFIPQFQNAMSTVQSTSRRSKNQKILFQTLTQNMLILVDTLNTTVTYKLFPVLFFQFLTLSFSMVFLRALEGFVQKHFEKN